MTDEEQPRLTEMISRIERACGTMPYGGTYFRHRTTNSGRPPIERLQYIEDNLLNLAHGLKRHADQQREDEKELWRYRYLIGGLRDLYDTVLAHPPSAVAAQEET